MTFTTIHLMRHGEVNNPEGILYGRLQGYGLTPLGKAMAERVADAFVFDSCDITKIAASPLLRAQETALPTALAYDLPIEADSRLLEATSKFEGKNVNRNRWALAHPRNWPLYMHPHRPSWGEPYLDILERMNAAISDMVDKAWGHEALMVSHQLPIVTVQRFIDGRPLSHNPLNRRCALASLTTLMFEDHTLLGWGYSEPAASLVEQARDVTPGVSGATTHS